MQRQSAVVRAVLRRSANRQLISVQPRALLLRRDRELRFVDVVDACEFWRRATIGD